MEKYKVDRYPNSNFKKTFVKIRIFLVDVNKPNSRELVLQGNVEKSLMKRDKLQENYLILCIFNDLLRLESGYCFFFFSYLDTSPLDTCHSDPDFLSTLKFGLKIINSI